MARLVRATHDLSGEKLARRRNAQPAHSVFMGGPDKPGHDERGYEVRRYPSPFSVNFPPKTHFGVPSCTTTVAGWPTSGT
ncbi:MAG: hypothetical protein JWQ29_2069 [Phenylobacterium sp.]|nr:hypothetical protein [Phenylobacterium sp.]